MKKMNRMMVAIALMACGLGATVAYSAQSDVDQVFRYLRRGFFTDVMKVKLSPREILQARNQYGDTLITEPILVYQIVDRSKFGAQEKIKNVISHFLKDLSPQQKINLLNTPDTNGQTALMLATQKRLSNIVKFLHNQGASVLKRDPQEKLASDYAFIRSDLKKMLKKFEREAFLKPLGEKKKQLKQKQQGDR